MLATIILLNQRNGNNSKGTLDVCVCVASKDRDEGGIADREHSMNVLLVDKHQYFLNILID